MIKFKTGNIFETNCDAIVCTVNCDGIMGKGLALECKTRYPVMYKNYQKICGNKIRQGGDLWYWFNIKKLNNSLFDKQFNLEKENESFDSHNILCFATKEHWYNLSKIEWIERGLQNFNKEIIEYRDWTGFEVKAPYYKACHIFSIAFPMLGCSNGGLDWNIVKPLMTKYLGDLSIDCEIYENN